MTDPVDGRWIENTPSLAAATAADPFFNPLTKILAPDTGLLLPETTFPLRILVWANKWRVRSRRISSADTDFLINIMASFFV
jgi:hypothetical protein